MKIDRIEIGAFGKFSDYSLDLDAGLQVLYGENEDGKTTLMAFLSMMFYGDQRRPRDLDQNLRKKYLPWSGTPMEGGIAFTVDGVSYHLSKHFAETFGKDRTTLINTDTGEIIALARGQEVGSYFFGMDLSSFQRSSYIGQIGRIDPAKGGDQISEKLLNNLMDTGDQEVSQAQVIKRLSDAKYQLINKSKTGGSLVELHRTLRARREELEQTQQLLERQKQAQAEYDALESLFQDKNRIEAALDGYQAKKELGQYTLLLEKKRQLIEMQQSLQVSGKSIWDLEKNLTLSDALAREIESLSKGIAPLELLLQESEIEITTDEYEKFMAVLQEQQELAAFWQQWQTFLLPALEDQLQARQKLESLQVQIEQLQNKIEELHEADDSWHAATLQSDLVAREQQELEEDFEHQRELWEVQNAGREEQIRSLEETIALQSSGKTAKWMLLSAAIITGIGFAALAYLQNSYFGFGGILSALLLILALVQRSPRSKELETKRETLREEQQTRKQLWESESIQLEQKIAERRQHYAQLQEQLTETAPLRDRRILLETERDSLMKQKGPQAATLESGTAMVRQYLEPYGDRFPVTLPISSKDALMRQEELICDAVDTIQQELNCMLVEKQAVNAGQYHQKYISFENNRGNRAKYQAMLQKRTACEEEYTLLWGFCGVRIYEDAVVAAQNISASITSLLTQQQEVALLENALDLPATTLEELEREIRRKEQMIREYRGEDPAALQADLEALNQRDLLKELQQKQKQIQFPARSLDEISEELADLELRSADMEQYYDAISLTLDVMESAEEELRRSFSPLLNEKAGAIFGELTQGRYQSIAVNKAYDIAVKSGIHYRDWRYLSHGTVDQAYLALRLAIAQMIRQPQYAPPLLLDDILMQYDNQRAEQTLQFLAGYAQAQQVQILLFTCHRHICDLVPKELPVVHILSESLKENRLY